jgi:hypothetical protein
VGDLVRLERERDVGDHRAQERHPLADEEQAEVAVPPERPDVHRGGPQEAADAARLDRRAGADPLGLSLPRVEVVSGHGRAGYARVRLAGSRVAQEAEHLGTTGEGAAQVFELP